jgi:diguanylate cyclase (GGDEF)-like protein
VGPRGPSPGTCIPCIMADTATFSFSRSGSSLFSPSEVRALMAIEFERSMRYSFPVCCLKLRVDRLVEISTLHGEEVRNRVLEAVVTLLRNATRSGDILGYLDGDRLSILLPHTDPHGVTFLADRLLAGARELEINLDDRCLRVSLSIGISDNSHKDADSFETMEKVAEEGVIVAESGGGNRWAKTDLYALHAVKAPQVPLPTKDLPTGQSADVRQRLIELMGDGGDLELAASKLAEELLNRANRKMADEREMLLEEAKRALEPDPKIVGKEDDYLREIDVLRRRVSKLTDSLGSTEREIARLRVAKPGEEGVASIYREVQGLQEDSGREETKRELMASIFAANLDLLETHRKSG